MSRYALDRRLRGETEFRVSEIQKIIDVLNLTNEEINMIIIN